MYVVVSLSSSIVDNIKQYSIGLMSIPSMEYREYNTHDIELLHARGINITGVTIIGGVLTNITDCSIVQIPSYEECMTYIDDNKDKKILNRLNMNNMYYLIVSNESFILDKSIEDKNSKSYVVCTYRGKESKYIGKGDRSTLYIESANLYTKKRAEDVAKYLSSQGADRWTAIHIDEAVAEDKKRKQVI